MKAGSVYVKNFSILHVSGAHIGEYWFIGDDYLVEFAEEEPKD